MQESPHGFPVVHVLQQRGEAAGSRRTGAGALAGAVLGLLVGALDSDRMRAMHLGPSSHAARPASTAIPKATSARIVRWTFGVGAGARCGMQRRSIHRSSPRRYWTAAPEQADPVLTRATHPIRWVIVRTAIIAIALALTACQPDGSGSDDGLDTLGVATEDDGGPAESDGASESGEPPAATCPWDGIMTPDEVAEEMHELHECDAAYDAWRQIQLYGDCDGCDEWECMQGSDTNNLDLCARQRYYNCLAFDSVDALIDYFNAKIDVECAALADPSAISKCESTYRAYRDNGLMDGLSDCLVESVVSPWPDCEWTALADELAARYEEESSNPACG